MISSEKHEELNKLIKKKFSLENLQKLIKEKN